MSELYYRLSLFFAPLSIGLLQAGITCQNKMLQVLKMVEQMDLKETSEWLTNPSKYTGFGASMAAKLLIGFWLGTGFILADRIVDSLNYCIGALTNSGSK